MADLPHGAWFDFAARYFPEAAVKPVADLFSGPGLMAAAGRTKGYRCIAVDNHRPFLKDGICADAAALPFADRAFAALCAANCSLNYLVGIEALERHLGECRRVLDDAGVYVFDVCPPERAAELDAQSLEALAGRVRFAHCYESPLQKLLTAVTITGEHTAVEHHVQRIFSQHDILRAAERTGFTVRDSAPNYGLKVQGAYTPIMTWVLEAR